MSTVFCDDSVIWQRAINVLEVPAVSIFRTEGWIFYPQDGDSRFLFKYLFLSMILHKIRSHKTVMFKPPAVRT
jgi:hypothetical protein